MMVVGLLDLQVVCLSKLAKMSSMSQNGANRAQCRGSPALGVRLADPLAFCQWGSAIGRPPMAEPPRWGASGPRLASSIRLFAPFPSVFGAFHEVPTLY